MHAWRNPSLTGRYEETKLTDGPAPKTKRAREVSAKEVRTAGANKSAILAKVPKYVYDSWASSMTKGSKVVGDLGTLRVTETPGQEPKYELILGTPATYQGVQITKLESKAGGSKLPMFTLDETAKDGAVAVDGIISQHCDFRNNMSQMSAREKSKLFEDRKRNSSKFYDDSSVMVKVPKPAPRISKDNKEKFVRKEKGALVSHIFELFAIKTNMTILELRNHTKQPVEWLKEVLREIAVHITKGPPGKRSTYQLQEKHGGPKVDGPEAVE